MFCAILIFFFVLVTCSSGSVLWRPCDTLCISGLTMTKRAQDGAILTVTRKMAPHTSVHSYISDLTWTNAGQRTDTDLVFTARTSSDSAVYAVVACLSVYVRPSVTSRCSTKTAERSITQPTPPLAEERSVLMLNNARNDRPSRHACNTSN